MGIKNTGTAAVKRNQKVTSVSKAKKATRSGESVSLSSRADIGNAIRSMAATVKKNSAELVMISTILSEKLAASDAKTAVIIEAMKQAQEETNLALRRTTQDLSEKLHKTTLELRRTTQDLSEKLHKTTLELRRTTQDLSEKLHKTTLELSESIHDIDSNVGGVNRRLGKVVELVVLPGLMEKMNQEYGYQFDNVAPNKKFTADGQLYAEMDLFLENGESVMAVEAKTRLTEGMVNAFVNKLELLRQHEVKAGLVGKTIYAAMAGIIFDDNAKKSVLEKGIYLVGIDQNNDKIKIEKPIRIAGEW